MCTTLSSLEKVCSIHDLQTLARKRVPKMFYDYVDSGAWSESTYKRNDSDFNDLLFRQRIGIDVAQRNTTSLMAKTPVTMPVALAPVGLAGMQYADGEILAARAAETFGVPFTLSSLSICSIEDVARQTSRPFWFQLYVFKDRDFTRQLMERARNAGCNTLVVTMDLPIMGQRHKDVKNRLSAPPRLTVSSLMQFLNHPGWCLKMARTTRRTFGNIVGHAKGVTNLRSLAVWTSEQLDASLSWKDLEWIRDQWDGYLIIKGVLNTEDLNRTIDIGAQAVVVSNHGGRQLDGAPSTIRTLAGIVEAANKQVSVLLDSGVRSGQDVLKAIALGAQGVLIGRAFVYGLGAAGQAGVAKALEIIHKEIESTMALVGETEIPGLGTHNLIIPGHFSI
ncbi:alpha-hydroxy acid oxidase [Endozoicomonas atrinae]|uniref:alpha-hydroxy acid oxidase n=1 Tax=Endozoicomonas atrinae TaxID=1333660 RepID=UPI0008264441|nr:alpha-hydroxy acid oxidase [Endozoicomonas atrinae]